MPDKGEPALKRNVYGALIYMGGYKKALLQSAPILLLGILTGWRVHRLRERWLLLLILPAGLLLYLGRTVWHGGLCLNLRYLLPALPVLSVAAAPALLALWQRLEHKRWTLPGAVLSVLMLLVGLSLERKVAVVDELVILWLPLMLAVLLLVVAWREHTGRMTALLLGATLSWGLAQGAIGQ